MKKIYVEKSYCYVHSTKPTQIPSCTYPPNHPISPHSLTSPISPPRPEWPRHTIDRTFFLTNSQIILIAGQWTKWWITDSLCLLQNTHIFLTLMFLLLRLSAVNNLFCTTNHIKILTFIGAIFCKTTVLKKSLIPPSFRNS